MVLGKSLPRSRRLLGSLALVLGLTARVTPADATSIPSVNAPATRSGAGLVEERRLRLYHTHTGEHIDVVFRRGDQYDAEALAKLNYFLRDHRKHEVLEYDPHEFDLLADLLEAVKRPDAEYAIICGYRTPTTNEMLRGKTTGVAEHSLHMQAKAIDIRLPGTDTARLRDAALAMKRGGVGYYRGSDFIHVDTGRVRRW